MKSCFCTLQTGLQGGYPSLAQRFGADCNSLSLGKIPQNIQRAGILLPPTLVIVSRMAWRSAGGGRPTYKVLSRRPGLSMAGSMISGKRHSV